MNGFAKIIDNSKPIRVTTGTETIKANTEIRRSEGQPFSRWRFFMLLLKGITALLVGLLLSISQVQAQGSDASSSNQTQRNPDPKARFVVEKIEIPKSNDQEVLKFGDPIAVIIKVKRLDNSIYYPTRLTFVLAGAEKQPVRSGPPQVLQITADEVAVRYPFYLPGKTMQTREGKTILDTLFRTTYQPLIYQRDVRLFFRDGRPEPANDIARLLAVEYPSQSYPALHLQYFTPLALWLSGIAVLLFYIIGFFSNKKSLIRDDSKCKDTVSGELCPTKNTFSLSRFQLWLWTLILFGATAVIWAATGHLPDYTASHLAIFGVSGGTLLLSRAVEQEKGKTQALRKNSLADDGGFCTRGFWNDLLSENGQLSISRLQNVVATFLFATVFVVQLVEQLALPELEAVHLTLMGMSSTIYLLQKRLDLSKQSGQ